VLAGYGSGLPDFSWYNIPKRFLFSFFVAILPKINHYYKEMAIRTDVAFYFMPGAWH
jgi:hypothetical protein